MVILVTGKAGAGKTTYAQRLARELTREGKNLVVIDSDLERQDYNDADFSDEGRLKHLMRMAEKARSFENSRLIVIMAAVAPKKSWRTMMRSRWKESRLVYIPGGHLWPGTSYERPDLNEL